VLAVALLVPALALPGNLLALPGPALAPGAGLATREAAEAALPFERPGMSFPGSAYFYLADPVASPLVALPSADPLSLGAEDGRTLGALIDVGAPAAPFFLPGTGITRTRAQECLAQAIWYEAASESEAGQRAVAQVVLNRVAHPAWPASVCAVVYQGAGRASGCQFTFTCDGSLARRPGGASWARAQRIAAEALSGSVYAPIGHATHYHALWVNPDWAGALDPIGTIGAHRFYRLRGKAGEKSAFAAAYAGFESGPAIHAVAHLPALPETAVPRAVMADDPDPPPAQAPAALALGAQAAAIPKPGYGAAGMVRPEYARAGQWKTRPDEATPATPVGAAE
jgi:spore germination cell wall hydrolase CwlJ-like protein